MSLKSDKLESDLVSAINNFEEKTLPERIPAWMEFAGIVPSSKIIKAEGIGSLSKDNKTDVIVFLENSAPLKISAKLLNADYFGNWYGHKRFIAEFGNDAFNRMTQASSDWANRWAETATAPYVGVSICFGRRGGRTGQKFTDIFTEEDILSVARGYGEGNRVANCMYISNEPAKNISDLFQKLNEISVSSVRLATDGFMIAHRPINPMTEYSNRGKNVYSQFIPYKKLAKPTMIKNAQELFSYGEFSTVESNSLNHNHILYNLASCYNIIIPKKEKC